MVKSVPVPDSATVWGLPFALSITVMLPLRAPVAVGVKVTLIAQLMVAANDAPQLFVSAKSPEAAIGAIFNVALPVFFSVIAWAGVLVVVTSWPPRFKLAGMNVATGALAVPMPVSAAVCGLLLSASVKTSVADSIETWEGVKVTLTVHEAPAARLLPHVLDEILKSIAGEGGVMAVTITFVMAMAVVSLLVRVTVWDAVTEPTSCVPKSTVAGETSTGSTSGNLATNASEVPLSEVWNAPAVVGISPHDV